MENYGDKNRQWSIEQLSSGRLGRLRYFLGSLALILPFAFLLKLNGLLQNTRGGTGIISSYYQFFDILTGLLGIISMAFWLLFHLLLAIRRCHDFGKTGWIAALTYVPYLGFLVALVLLFKEGDAKENEWGGPPPIRGFWADIFNY